MFKKRFTKLFNLVSIILILQFNNSCSSIDKNDAVVEQRIEQRIVRLNEYITSIDFSLELIETSLKEGEIKNKVKDLKKIEAYGHITAMMAYEKYNEAVQIPKQELEAMLTGGDVSKLSSVVKTKEENQTILTTRLQERKELMQSEIETLQEIRQIGLAEYVARDMVSIPAGSFTMGSEFHETGMPVHKVTIKQFYLSKYEITEMLWYLVMGNPRSVVHEDYHDFALYYCSDCPIDVISWQHAKLFIEAINQMTNSDYRLPTEAEWEYACRSGGKEQEYCGGDDLETLGWFSKNYGNKDKTDPMLERFHAFPVGLKQPNSLGLYDMSGNVAEWVEDCWHANYQDAPTDGNAWAKENCQERVFRGGAYIFPDSYNSSSYREYGAKPNSTIFGFRLAKHK